VTSGLRWGLLLWLGGSLAAQDPLVLRVSGVPGQPSLSRSLLQAVFAAEGVPVRFVSVGTVPIGRREAMLTSGELTVATLGETPGRNAAFLPIRVPVTDGLESQRLLLVPRGAQGDYEGVKTLEDFRRLGKVAGVASSWAEGPIWQANGLGVQAVDGDWQVLFSLVASRNRGLDYLPRGANEVARDLATHPQLVLERHLVLVYPGDHLVYLSPHNPELRPLLTRVLTQALATGVIHRWAVQTYPEAFRPELGLDSRTVLMLKRPSEAGEPVDF